MDAVGRRAVSSHWSPPDATRRRMSPAPTTGSVLTAAAAVWCSAGSPRTGFRWEPTGAGQGKVETRGPLAKRDVNQLGAKNGEWEN